MIGAYVDDSFDREFGLYVLSAYIGDADIFDTALSPAWREVIKNAPHPLKEWHSTNHANASEEFSNKVGWNNNERKQIITDIVSVITDDMPKDKLFGCASIVTFPGRISDDEFEFYEEAGFTCNLLEIIQQIFSTARLLLEPEETVQVVLDEKPKVKGLVDRYFYKTLEKIDKSIAARIHYPMFRHSHELEPLQAADLLAYETFKEAKSRVYERRPVRIPLRRIVAAHAHQARCSTVHQIVEILRRKKEGLPLTIADRHLWPMLFYESGTPWRDKSHWPFIGHDGRSNRAARDPR